MLLQLAFKLFDLLVLILGFLFHLHLTFLKAVLKGVQLTDSLFKVTDLLIKDIDFLLLTLDLLLELFDLALEGLPRRSELVLKR